MIHGTRPCLPNYTKISPNFANQAHRTGCGRACGPHLSCYSSPRITIYSSRLARPPRRRSRRQPHHSASSFLLRFCIATQGPELPAYYSSRICHRPRRGSLPFLGSLGGRCWARCLEAKKTPKAQVTSIDLS